MGTDDNKKKQYARQNEFISKNYERQTVVFPKGTKAELSNKGVKSINKFLNEYVDSFLGRSKK